MGPTARHLRLALLLAPLCAGLCAAPALAREFPLGLLTLAGDERYDRAVLEKGLPDAPGGRSAAAAELALEDAGFVLQGAGWTGGTLVPVEVQDPAGVAAAIEQLARRGVRHVVLELPAAAVAQATAAARGRDMVLFNAAAPDDALRAAQCAPQLLHTLPSHAMQADALGQLLVARKWARPLVLTGPTPQDALLGAAFQRTAKRFGLKPVAQRPFKLSNDPRERDLGNPRLLTAGGDHDVVLVLDAQGEFARDLPYRTQLPRPVAGSAGLTAQAWSPAYERHGAPQLSRRFHKRAGRPMTSYDWATWTAARAAAEVAARHPRENAARHLAALRAGEVALDGYKGVRLTFRPWDGQLRQPLLLAHGHGVAELAPVEGFLHPRSSLDTLGVDQPETGCKG